MRCIAFAALSALLGALLSLSPAQADVLVNISKSQQRASVTVDGTELYRWPVSTGRSGHDTPAGKFSAIRLERHWYSRQYEMTPMPWAVFFHRGYAVHATMEAYNLGHAASHGCVRLRPDNAAILYSLVRRQGMANTKIVVMNGALPAAPLLPAPTVPGANPAGMVELDDASPEQVANAESRAEFSAKAYAPADVTSDDEQLTAQRTARFARTVSYRVSVSSDEGQVLREREAWFRSLDRKYGITH